LSRTTHDIVYDDIHDEIVMGNPFGGAILTFRGGADKSEAPLRVIQGPHTKLKMPERATVDPVHNEIFEPEPDYILAFPREANGDAAPIRIISGPNTGLMSARAIATDPVHDLIIVSVDRLPADYGEGDSEGGGGRGGAFLIFKRTDNGNVKPQRIIRGIAATNQIAVYTPKSWFAATQSGRTPEGRPDYYVGIWSINDNGKVSPRWRLGGPESGLKNLRGVALDPKHKEFVTIDTRLNAALTFYYPEIF